MARCAPQQHLLGLLLKGLVDRHACCAPAAGFGERHGRLDLSELSRRCPDQQSSRRRAKAEKSFGGRPKARCTPSPT